MAGTDRHENYGRLAAKNENAFGRMFSLPQLFRLDRVSPYQVRTTRQFTFGRARLRRAVRGGHEVIYTIGRKRPTTSCSRSLIWPNEQTSAASSKAGKQFSSVSTMSASLSSAA